MASVRKGWVFEVLGVVFVHGINSSARMWDPFGGLIAGDEQLTGAVAEPSPRFGYATGLVRLDPRRVIPSLDTAADSLKEYVVTEAGGFERLVLVGHSQGGLVIQRTLVRMLAEGRGRELERIRHVVLLACPNTGSQFLLTLRRRVVRRNAQENVLRPFDEQLADTRRTLMRDVVHAREVSERTCPILFSVYAGESDAVVSPASARDAFPQAAALPGNHKTIARPGSREHRTYSTLKRLLLEAADSDPPTGAVTTLEDRPGRTVAQCDPILLGVRPGIDPDTETGAGRDLTRFVRRAHDGELRRRVAAGGVVALLGSSSTGKSRSAWEAVRALDPRWRLWQPGSWADLQRVQAHTVIWLNDPDGHLSEENAEQLARLVSDTDRAPVTVLITLWRDGWTRLTADTEPGTADPHHWARTLLTSRTPIDVPDTFTPLDQHDLDNAARSDPRWARALQEADCGAVVQYFAGVPALVSIYRSGSRMAQALIEAAMDARRLGASAVLPRDFLLDAAIGYPSEAQWAKINGTAWPAEALSEVSAPVRGLAGPLSPKTPRARTVSEPLGYVLAPYLEQLGRTDRATEPPPESFWAAARQHLPPEDWTELAASCDRRGLFRTGATLRRAAVLAGHAAKAGELLRRVPDAGTEVARWLLDHAQTADLDEVQHLAQALTERGAAEATVELYRRAARDVDLSTWGISMLMKALGSVGDEAATAAFLARGPGHELPPNIELLEPLAALDRAAAEQLVNRLTPPPVLAYRLIDALCAAGFSDRVAEIVPAIPLCDDDDLIELVRALHAHGFDEEVRRLLGQHMPTPHLPQQAAVLLSVLADLGDSAGVTALIETINADDLLSSRFWWFPALLESVPAGVRDRLALREPSTAADGSAGTAGRLLKVYLSVEDEVADRAEALRGLPRAALDQRVATVDPADPFELLVLLRALGDRPDSRAALVDRVDADRLAMIPGSTAGLAVELGPGELARAVMVRLTAEADPWNNKNNRRIIIPALKTLGFIDLVDRLTERYADGGNYSAFLDAHPDRAGRFRYGREPDGTPSPRWGWPDLT